ncbi:hypothetical protein ACH4D4_04890 [Streptomyces pristinaespiralis]|uniref:hypothetical protein n=1 Tax=Streptomyces pristinaespiralis TaxID=38300 RepID=UPI0037A1634D
MSTEAEPLTIPAGWDQYTVIPGQTIDRDDLGDDIAPGVIEVVPDHTPVLYRTASAAMVVAAKTGKAVGLTARGAWKVGQPLAVGTGALAYLGYRYVRAHDVQEVLGGMTKKSDLAKVEQTRRSRWKLLGWGAGATAALNVAGWWALVKYAGLTALDWSWAVTPGIEALAVGAVAYLYGRYRLANPGLPAGQIVADEDQDDGEEPFPLAHCVNGEQVEECVARALAYKGIGTRRVQVLGHRGWGWEVDVDLRNSTAGKVNAAADDLDGLFNIANGATLIEPDLQQSAHVTMRLIQSDPFADMPRPTVHAPNSLSVKDAVVYGRGMDGSPLEFRLRGMSMVIIGASGSAKTKGAMRCLAEAITACRDAIAIEMDPVKDGLSEFADAMALPPIRGGKECTQKLRYLRDIASARNQVKTAKDMGDLWEPSPENPTIYGFIDEFIYMTQEAKELAIEILRIGRETGVHLIFAAQESTAEALGDAIAGAVTYRVMLASRSEDIRLVFGTGAAAMGYRPDRLRPAVDDERVYDAGKFYLMGPGYNRPIQWRWNRFDRDQIRQAVKDRAAAGRPWFDQDSLAAADLLHVITRGGSAGEVSVADRLDALAAQAGIEHARLVAVLLREYELSGHSFLPTGEVLLPALHGAGAEDMDATKLAQMLRSHAPNAAAGREEWDGRPQVRGWHKSTVERAAAGLIDPSKARLQAA